MAVDVIEVNGRGERIRTSGLLVPNQALYQAEPRPDEEKASGTGHGKLSGGPFGKLLTLAQYSIPPRSAAQNCSLNMI